MPPVSRTSSYTSLSSASSTTSTYAALASGRRRRTRFTNGQLAMLERLYHKCSHPTREERENLAWEAGMDTKHVTIWFQNKRQVNRRVALHNATNRTENHANINNNNNSGHYHHHFILQPPSFLSLSPPIASYSPPSLDHIATRSELHNPPSLTRARTPNPTAIWATMPSSPPAPSPGSNSDAREDIEEAYIALGRQRGRRTLEWACARASARGGGWKEKEGENIYFSGGEGQGGSDVDDLGCDGEETDEDEEAHEAVTPHSSFNCGDGVGMGTGGRKARAAMNDEEITAAYVLCGLGLGLR